MRLILLGAPGAGKGTQARGIAQQCRLPQGRGGEAAAAHYICIEGVGSVEAIRDAIFAALG